MNLLSPLENTGLLVVEISEFILTGQRRVCVVDTLKI